MNKHFAKNTVIFRAGDVSEGMFEVVSGSVSIFANYGGSAEKLLATLSAGDSFGEMSLLEELPRSADAVAAADETELRCISKEEFPAYLCSRPEKAVEIMKHMSVRIRSLTADYLDACKTITEMNKEGGKKHTPGLLKCIEKYINDYANKQVSAFGNNLEATKQLWT